jgi:Restriction endonuclease
MITPQEKGNALEAAVVAIEELILRTSPNVKEKTYLIESKKRINVGGVHHEIDLFVTFELGPGYKPVYIFECKNWKEAVDKNEIIVFAEKIAAAGAQRGFFVAKSFTADAVAQANKEPRMELVIASEHDPASTILPIAYHSTFMKPTRVKGTFKKWGEAGKEFLELDLSQAVATLNGNPLNLPEYLNAWVNEAMNENMRTFPSGALADGTYQRECGSERTFEEGLFVVNETAIRTAMITVQFEIYLVRPAVKSHFEIGGRGRVISFEAHTAGDLTVNEVHCLWPPIDLGHRYNGFSDPRAVC